MIFRSKIAAKCPITQKHHLADKQTIMLSILASTQKRLNQANNFEQASQGPPGLTDPLVEDSQYMYPLAKQLEQVEASI